MFRPSLVAPEHAFDFEGHSLVSNLLEEAPGEMARRHRLIDAVQNLLFLPHVNCQHESFKQPHHQRQCFCP